MEIVDMQQWDLQKVQNFIIGLGSGGLFGVITGAALKHMAKRVAIALGTVFIFIQVFQFFGFVEVHWDKVSEKAIPVFDANKDGMLTEDDIQPLIEKIMRMAPEILANGIVNAAGFATGMIIAFWFL